MNILSVYLTNLGKYNEGYLIGEWLQLPATEEEINACMNRIGINDRYEEWFITDYESDLGLTAGEYDNLSTLNELCETIENSDMDPEIFASIYGELNDIDATLSADYMVYWDCNDMTDVAYQYIEETGMLSQVPDSIANYFDYEAFGRDMSYDGSWISFDHGYIEVLY